MKRLNKKSLEKKIKEIEYLLINDGYELPKEIYFDSEQTQLREFDNNNNRSSLISKFYNSNSDLEDSFVSIIGKRLNEDGELESIEYFIVIGKRLTIENNQ